MKVNEVQTKKETAIEKSYRAQAKDYAQMVKIFTEEGFSREEAMQILTVILSAFLSQNQEA